MTTLCKKSCDTVPLSSGAGACAVLTLDPGSGIQKKSILDPESRLLDPNPIFLTATVRDKFLGKKGTYYNS